MAFKPMTLSNREQTIQYWQGLSADFVRMVFMRRLLRPPPETVGTIPATPINLTYTTLLAQGVNVWGTDDSDTLYGIDLRLELDASNSVLIRRALEGAVASYVFADDSSWSYADLINRVAAANGQVMAGDARNKRIVDATLLIANSSILAGASGQFCSDAFDAKAVEAPSALRQTCKRRGRNMRLEMRRTKLQIARVTASLG